MNYKIAICDDCAADRDYILKLTREWADTTKQMAQVELFSSAESFLFHYAEKKDYDILFLDVEMGAMDGVTLARSLRMENETIQIVFITGYSDYISEGYEVAALHYLMKPVKKDKLFSVLERAVKKLQKNEKVLTFEVLGETIRIPVYQIRYADVQRNYITIHAEKELTVKMPLGDLLSMLDERFYRAGRSIIVNLTRITRVTKKEIHLQDGTILPLPRGAYEGVNRAIISM